MGNRLSISPRSIAIAIAVIGSLVYASSARAVVSADPLQAPLNGWVGYFRGSSCVAVGNLWCVTAKHVGDGAGYAVYMRGQWYTVVETVPHPIYDVQLLRVAEALPGYHHFASNVGLGDPCVLGGWGATAGAALPNNAGYDWSGCSENIYAGSGSPESAHQGWIHSSGHHRNILTPAWIEMGSGQAAIVAAVALPAARMSVFTCKESAAGRMPECLRPVS